MSRSPEIGIIMRKTALLSQAGGIHMSRSKEINSSLLKKLLIYSKKINLISQDNEMLIHYQGISLDNVRKIIVIL